MCHFVSSTTKNEQESKKKKTKSEMKCEES